jgi:hypothetical protein
MFISKLFFYIFSYCFDVLISKIIFLKNKKKIIFIYFKMKSILNRNQDHNSKDNLIPISKLL